MASHLCQKSDWVQTDNDNQQKTGAEDIPLHSLAYYEEVQHFKPLAFKYMEYFGEKVLKLFLEPYCMQDKMMLAPELVHLCS